MGEEQTTAVVQRYLNALAEDSSARRKDRPLRRGYFCRSWQEAGYPPISPLEPDRLHIAVDGDHLLDD
jgi:hypothetical protein